MIKTYSAEALRDLTRRATETARRRAHLNVHDTLDAPVQRLFIALEPDTYVRPHRHSQPDKWELFVVLDGALDVLIFDAQGGVARCIPLSAVAHRAVEIAPNTWHSLICRQAGTLAFEVKQGPYTPTDDKDFAPWAPDERSTDAAAYLQRLRDLRTGARAP